ncbi:hypothetical protein PLICRDRAFT_170188 [Plicaturopsis crispa FD-325 SS-3]|nr:hypothetical protein PLICRDRAFT_170188 [Plicaturopsis crispa FD-325 SS-3]
MASTSATSTAHSQGEATSPPKGPYTTVEVLDSVRSEQIHAGPYPIELEKAGPEVARNFSLFSIIGLAYAILNSWTAMAASLSVALPSGGPTAVIWGIVVSMIGNLAMAASLAEICHVYPTSGGQYHWSAILAPADWAPAISWTTGWFAVAGWWALVATTGSLAGQLITGVIALMHEAYVLERWHIFLIYITFIIGACLLNIFGVRLLPMINRAAITWSLAGAALICIVCLACASPNYQSGKFVFGTFINETGWNDGAAWILGLLQSSFGLTAYDAVSHMVEEMPQPHINAPKAMVLAVIIGSVSSFIFLIILLFCITAVEDVISSSAGALLAAIYQATGSIAGSVCLQMFPIVSMAFAAQGILTASSRMSYSFARDGGLPFSPFFAQMRPNGVPVNAVLLSTVLVIIFGLVYLGSSSALNAILSSSVVALNVSYSIPIALLLCRGRHLLAPPSLPKPTMTLGPILGPICNVIGLAFTALTTVFFLFPPELPVTGTNMNYTVCVFFIVFCVAMGTWIFKGRKEFTGPRDLGALLELARAEAVPPTPSAEKKREEGGASVQEVKSRPE